MDGTMKTLLLSLFLMSSCICSFPDFDQEVLGYYELGRSRQAIHRDMDYKPLQRLSKPKEGWSKDKSLNQGADFIALYFEKEKKVEVKYMDVYWVNKDQGSPFKKEGLFWDYLLFDQDKKLLGHHRKVFN
jgi:hypothetical protein